MGHIKKGILGGFSGTIGNVVGANWKGIAYMRTRPQKIKNPRTPAQVEHRRKFAYVVNFLKPLIQRLQTTTIGLICSAYTTKIALQENPAGTQKGSFLRPNTFAI
jgi:hypothetical protein